MAGMDVFSQLFGTGLDMFGSAQEGAANEASYEAQAAIARLNAQAAKDAYIVDAAMLERDITKQLGQQKANVAASGLEFSGSAMDILAESETFAALDREVLRYNMELAVAQYEYEAAYYDYAATQAEQAGGMDVISSLVGGVGGMFG